MQTLIQFLINIAPVLILAATAIYLFHEYMRVRSNKVSEKPKEGAVHYKETPLAPPRNETLIQLKLQACERFALYLERIAPGRLVMRLHKNGMTSKMLQAEMVKVIREEFDHNLSQQIYLSDTCWELVKNAKEEMTKLVNIASDALGTNSSGIDLGKKMFEVSAKMKKMPHEIALGYLREEAHRTMEQK